MVSDTLEKYHIVQEADNLGMVADIKASAATVYAGTCSSVHHFHLLNVPIMISETLGAVETVGLVSTKRPFTNSPVFSRLAAL